MKSYEQLEQQIKDGAFTRDDAVKVFPHVDQLGPEVLKSLGITLESDEDRRESGLRILRLLREFILGPKSE